MKLIEHFQQFTKFSIVAIGYNLAAYILYSALIFIKINYLISSTLSFIFGITLSYIANKSIVFVKKQHRHSLILYYFGYYTILLGVTLTVLHGLITWLKVNPYYAQICVTMFTAIISYNAMHLLFSRKDNAPSGQLE